MSSGHRMSLLALASTVIACGGEPPSQRGEPATVAIVEAPTAEPTAKSPPLRASDPRDCHVPRDFELSEMASAALPEAVASDARILAWLIQEDDRPLRVERALLWLETRASQHDPARYHLADVYRHPLDKSRMGRRWHLSLRSHMPPPIQSYMAPPSLAEIADFTAASDWTYGPSSGFQLIDGSVCHAQWQRSVGSPAPAEIDD